MFPRRRLACGPFPKTPGGSMTSEPDRYYLLRLIPPRPTFPQDMTEAERKVMQAHVAYWTERVKEGRMIVFGPVADPAGPWGVGVLCVKDDAEAHELKDQDPVVVSTLGFRYEVLPMPRAITR
jgi:uncharacterized protein YciI